MHDVASTELRLHWGRDGKTAPPVRICPNPIFVIGSPRSGTTALARALAKHSHLWTGDESQILADLFGDGHLDRNYRRRYRPDGSWLLKENVSRPEFLSFLGLGVNALFSSRSGDRRWVDHTPNYTLMVESIADMFPGAVFLNIVRDGRRVINSMVNYYNRLTPEERESMDRRRIIMPWGRDFTEACRFWSRYAERGMLFGEAHPSRCLTVRNEDVVADPSTGFAQIFEFVGEPYEKEPVEFFSSNRINSSFQKDSSDRASVKKLASSNPWLEWSREQRQIFRDEAGEVLVRLKMAVADDLREPQG